jgi:uncharacterized membrane protein YfcA
VQLLTWSEPAHVRAGIGALLVLFSLYSLLRPAMRPITAGGRGADAGVGLLNGALAGLTGLSGVLVTIWCGLRGWPKDQQRAVFQPVAVGIFAITAVWFGASGALTGEIAWLFVLGLPALFAGTWAGMRLYGRLDEAGFRKVVLVLLLVSGVALLVQSISSDP